MKGLIKKFIFTDKTIEGKPLINKLGVPFFMLHLEVEFPDRTIILSKYYTQNKEEKLKKIFFSINEDTKKEELIEQEYFFSFSTNVKGENTYYNIKNIFIGEKIIDL